MNRAVRKYHRILAIIFCLPLLLTVISGILLSFIDEWLGNPDLANTFRQIHTLKIVGLERFFPLLNGLALLGLLFTGISMTGVFHKRLRRT